MKTFARRARGLVSKAASFVAGKPGRAMIVASVALVVGGAGVLVAVAAEPGHTPARPLSVSSRTQQPPQVTSDRQVPPLQVVSVTPAHGARDVNGANPVSVQFSAPLAASSPMPVLRPAVAGSWSENGTMAVFTPSVPFRPSQTVSLRIPGGQSGVRSAAGGLLTRDRRVIFHTSGWSTLRLEQLLAQLRYLPLSWNATAGQGSGSNRVAPADSAGTSSANGLAAQLAAVYSPPAGTFQWRQTGYPTSLTSLWQPGQSSLILTGAVMAFEADHGMSLDGVAGPAVWHALLRAVVKGQHNTHGYTYAVADKGSPETLTIWHNGSVVERTLVNTGIPGRPTADGTFPVYLRYVVTIMKGTNPDGSKYSDVVHWVSYFNGGDAVHYFPRGSYGFPQSLGCVELPYAPAVRAYSYLSYGSLVSVIGNA